jgi:hypothetical protein
VVSVRICPLVVAHIGDKKVKRLHFCEIIGQITIYASDRDSQTPLLWAAICGREAVVKLLLGKGADPDRMEGWCDANIDGCDKWIQSSGETDARDGC